MNLEELKRLATEAKARAEKATPGPWHAFYHDNDDELGDVAFCVAAHDPAMMEDYVLLSVDGCDREDEREQWPLDVEFAAAARTDVPALADAVLALVAELERVAARVDDVYQAAVAVHERTGAKQ